MKKKKFAWFSGGQSAPNAGALMKLHWSKPNNLLAPKIKTTFNGVSPNRGVWSNANTYNPGDRVYLIDADPTAATRPMWVYRTKEAISAGEGAPGVLSKWELDLGLEMIQPAGDGTHYFRYILGANHDAWTRIREMSYGHLSTVQWLTGDTGLYNYPQLGTSTTSIAIPTVHPSSITLTIAEKPDLTGITKLTIYNDSTHYIKVTKTSYDQSTGVLQCSTGTTGANRGTGTFSSWTVYLGWKGQSMAITPGTGTNNYSAFYIGESFRVTFVGTYFTHRSFRDNRGMGWRYNYISGPNSSSPPSSVLIDTYNASSQTTFDNLVFSNLTYGTHVVEAVLENSPTPASANTDGWVRGSSDTTSSKTVYCGIDEQIFVDEEIPISPGDAVGEMALRFRLNANAGDTTEWVPDHGPINRIFLDSKSIVIDDITINQSTIDGALNPYLYNYLNFTNVILNQAGNVYHPQDAGSFATLVSTHTLSKYGLDYDVTLTWLKVALIAIGYSNMVTLDENWGKMKTENGSYYVDPADNTISNISSIDTQQSSYIFYWTTVALKDIAVSQSWPNPSDFRTGLPNSSGTTLQNFTGLGGSKFYPGSYSNYITSINEVMRFRARLFIGNFPDANNNL